MAFKRLLIARMQLLREARKRELRRVATGNARKRGQQRRGGRMDLDSTLNPESWWAYFGFSRSELDRLARALQLPHIIRADNGIIETRRMALVMLLTKFKSHLRLKDIYLQFGWELERVSRIVVTTLRHIHVKWKHLLEFDYLRLTPARLEGFARIIQAKSRSPLGTVFGFVDGTVRKISRPSKRQRTVYNGWKRYHALKYHGVVTPDGIIVHFFGPMEGRRHDRHLWQKSKIMDYLIEHAKNSQGQPLQLYGDPAYGLNRHLISPFKSLRYTTAKNIQQTDVKGANCCGMGVQRTGYAFPIL
ncbi:hypothetical protein BJ508DRAFT_378754 [Ascobolus immersus RN42]|uniref:DDE Tnp4 domain-containing protein n=1 Tax=Ascobolus immersus RN42 TaxID=1160509 RepID=A0A3N4HZ07_ASCIM|nr:hypothetical protein BJ508DRAFT_378754 [Ascobolus immersus RN42]